MKQTILPNRYWYQTDDGRWASKEKTREDRAQDQALKAKLGIGEVTFNNAFAGMGVAAERAADALLALGAIAHERGLCEAADA